MAREDAFTVEGKVMEVMSDRLFQLQLSNGHRLLAYGSAKWKHDRAAVQIGDRLLVQVSPFDLSKGAIQI
ncbi:MAG: translation initiation factor IF-1 [Opitutaceae bacterium]|nr:translation initiation factor IF-1 [Verrucomicrobiales bacterium]